MEVAGIPSLLTRLWVGGVPVGSPLVGWRSSRLNSEQLILGGNPLSESKDKNINIEIIGNLSYYQYQALLRATAHLGDHSGEELAAPPWPLDLLLHLM